ncbi:hypothetical protein B0H12DRAFT_1325796, partial [Mycena haematopus]
RRGGSPLFFHPCPPASGECLTAWIIAIAAETNTRTLPRLHPEHERAAAAAASCPLLSAIPPGDVDANANLHRSAPASLCSHPPPCCVCAASTLFISPPLHCRCTRTHHPAAVTRCPRCCCSLPRCCCSLPRCFCTRPPPHPSPAVVILAARAVLPCCTAAFVPASLLPSHPLPISYSASLLLSHSPPGPSYE